MLRPLWTKSKKVKNSLEKRGGLLGKKLKTEKGPQKSSGVIYQV